MDTLLLSRKDIEGIIDFESAYAAARDAYKAFSSGKVVQPPIVSIEIPAHHGELDIKSGYSAMEEIIGVKTASGYPETPGNTDWNPCTASSACTTQRPATHCA